MTSEPETEAETSEVSLTVSPDREDPNLWLEEVEGERALEWVRAQNARTLEHLQSNPAYAELEAAALEVVNSSTVQYATDRCIISGRTPPMFVGSGAAHH